MEQTLLATLLMEEVSGVDDPANQVPGWMVTKSADGEQAASESIVAKVKGLLSTLGAPTGKEIDMEKDELLATLEERDEALVAKVAEAVAKSVAPAEGAAEEVPATAEAVVEAPVGVSVEDVTKAIEDAIVKTVIEPHSEIFEKILDRLEGVESALGVAARKSLDGQEANEGEPVTKSTPDLGDAIAAAFKR